MERIYIKGRAKINLALDITGKREDGYHDISTIMQSLTLYDNLQIQKVYKPSYLKVVSNLPWLPGDHRNLAWQAAKYLVDRFGINEGIFIKIDKAIPASAGLAGGSADCAAALLGVRNLFNLPISDLELQEVSVRFGADVPFCVMGGCAHATGIGEVLVPLPPLPLMHIVIVKPNLIVSTEDVFKRFRQENVERRPDIEGMIKSIRLGDLGGICNNMANVLESVTAVRYPIINEIKDFVKSHGALGAMMTGSGPTVFGIFEDKNTANMAASALKIAYPRIKTVYVTTPYYPIGNNEK